MCDVSKRLRERQYGEFIEEEVEPVRRKRNRFSTLLRRLFLLALLVALTPFALILLYRWESVRPVSTLMLAGYVSGQEVNRVWVEFDDIAPVLVQSVMMSEDGQFCAHDGIDWEALNTVIDGALEGEDTRGASTIPMQTAKNLFLWPARSFVRKALEIPLAMTSDYLWDKRRLMEIYLNVAEWAPGIYGIESAAQHHFGVSAAQLGSRQAALLAVTLPNPHQRNPANPSNGLARLAGNIETRAAQSGAYIRCLYP
jgi:monofunctional biosynthetic peptidoglycan transglycosylase